jgi:protein gp37
MADKSPIEWTEATWNPIVGCSVISPGCTNCYAMREAGRWLRRTPKFAGLTQPSKAGPVWTGDMRLWEKALDQPLRWKKPRRIFVNSMSDLFHESLPDEWIDRVFGVMSRCPQHRFQVLTKRSERMRDYYDGDALNRITARLVDETGEARLTWPLPNVHLGVSVEDQDRIGRVKDLIMTRAAVRWVSAEPLLGPLDFTNVGARDYSEFGRPMGLAHGINAFWKTTLRPRIEWVVLGGESGRDARPMDSAWARSVRDQCRAAGVPFFFKQWGEWLPRDQLGWRDPTERYDGCEHTASHVRVGKKAAGRLLDGVTWDEYPRGV